MLGAFFVECVGKEMKAMETQKKNHITTYNQLAISSIKEGIAYPVDCDDFYCEYYLLYKKDGALYILSAWQNADGGIRVTETQEETGYQLIKMGAHKINPEETLEIAVCTMLELYDKYMGYEFVPDFEVIDTDLPFDLDMLIDEA